MVRKKKSCGKKKMEVPIQCEKKGKKWKWHHSFAQ